MAKYRKKPVLIEAFQFTRERCVYNSEWPQWLHEARREESEADGAMFPVCSTEPHGKVFLRTLEGPLRVDWGDWIIRGVKGELYPCKPDIFEATYELVEGATP